MPSFQNKREDIFYLIDRCSNKLELDSTFLEYFMEQIVISLKEREFYLLQKDIGLSVSLEEGGEEKLINFLREKACEMFLESEIFVCTMGWENNKGVKLPFKNKDVLIANYEKETVEENIRRVLDK